MEYTVNGIITLSPASKRRLSADMHFVSPSKTEVFLSSRSDDEISASIKLEANDDTSANEIAQLELSRICNILSFYCSIGVSRSRISGMSRISTSRGHIDLSVTVTLGLKATADVVVTLGDKSLSKLVSYLQQDYSDDFEEAIDIWREAFSRESSVERFFSLYRLMELLFDNNIRNMEDWIKKQDASVQLIPANEFRKYEHTIYTFLRDNVHYKKERKLFPIKEIQGNLTKFQTLVQQRIKEKYNIQ
ncbi:MAG: hypothetical protein WB564_05450 [Dehalococcoidia bacterium]